MRATLDQLEYSPDRPPRHRRPRVRRWLLIGAVLVLVVPAVLLAVTSFQLRRMKRHVADMDARYRQVERGMSVSQVRSTMGSNGVPHAGPSFPAWDDEPLDDADAKRITTAIRYHAAKLPVSVVFEFTFDRDGKVVGKHRYD